MCASFVLRYTYVYIYKPLHLYTYISAYTHIHVHICVYVYIYIWRVYVCKCACTYVRWHALLNLCVVVSRALSLSLTSLLIFQQLVISKICLMKGRMQKRNSKNRQYLPVFLQTSENSLSAGVCVCVYVCVCVCVRCVYVEMCVRE